MIAELSRMDLVVIGETHYREVVQKAEAQVIRSLVEHTRSHGKFTVGWEFLNRGEQPRVRALFSDFKDNKISAEGFLGQTQGSSNASLYAAVLEAVKVLNGDLIGTNLSRAQKLPVLNEGLLGLDPLLLPPNYERGDCSYFQRFEEAMANHIPPDKLDRYFEAQSLTDDVMAYAMIEDSQSPLKFLIAGHFHTDYSSGVVARLKARGSACTRVATVRIEDASLYSATEWADVLKSHPTYGCDADYFYFLGEPKPAEK